MSLIFPPLDYIFLFPFHVNFIFYFFGKRMAVYRGKVGTYSFLNIFIFSC